jgi:short-subunit dehydrogenase
VKGTFSETSLYEELNLISLQCLSYIRLTKLFIPGMIERAKGGVLNVGSTGSFAPGPFNAVYCAAKSFVLSFSEALAEELSGSGVKVTALCPGGIDTNFRDLSKRKKSLLFPLMKATKVAKAGFNGLMKGKRVVVPGWANRLHVFAVRFLPRSFVTRFNARHFDLKSSS